MLKLLFLYILFYACFLLHVTAQSCPPCLQPNDKSFNEYYSAKALKIVEDLNYKISIIGDKRTFTLDCDKAIKNACNLFVNKGGKDVFIEVSSLDHTRIYTRLVK